MNSIVYPENNMVAGTVAHRVHSIAVVSGWTDVTEGYPDADCDLVQRFKFNDYTLRISYVGNGAHNHIKRVSAFFQLDQALYLEPGEEQEIALTVVYELLARLANKARK